MRNKIAIPPISYVVFELVKVNIDDYIKAVYTAEQVETIYLAVIPQQFSYRLVSRDAILQTDKRVFVDKYDLAPERCTISGNFGVQPRFIAGSYMDGWSRLKQFEEEIVRRAKKSELPDADGNRYVYALNYYDFIWQRFGSINIQSFTVTGNARENTKLPRYSLDFLIVGDLIISEGEKDFFLEYLKEIYGKGGLIDKTIDELNEMLKDETLNTVLQGAAIDFDSLALAVNLVNGALDFISAPDVTITAGYENIVQLF